MGRNLMAYLHIRLGTPYLGCVGSENTLLLELSDEEIIKMNEPLHTIEVKSMLQELSHLPTYIKHSNR